MQQASIFIGRLFLAHIFVLAGFNKIVGYADTVGYMQSQGVPGWLLPLVILLELGGGILIILDWQTRLVAAALAGFCVLSALIFHANFAEQSQMALFMKNFAMAGGFLMLMAHGAGHWSLDDRLGKTRAPGE